MGKQMEPLHAVPAAAITLILSLLVAVFTECTSNVATTTLFLPIFASMVSNLMVGRGPSTSQEAANPWPCCGSLMRQRYPGQSQTRLWRPGSGCDMDLCTLDASAPEASAALPLLFVPLVLTKAPTMDQVLKFIL